MKLDDNALMFMQLQEVDVMIPIYENTNMAVTKNIQIAGTVYVLSRTGELRLSKKHCFGFGE